jgi:hypothetical protein
MDTYTVRDPQTGDMIAGYIHTVLVDAEMVWWVPGGVDPSDAFQFCLDFDGGDV